MINNEYLAIKPFIPKQLFHSLSQIRKELFLFDRIFIPHFKETLDVLNLVSRIKTGVPIQDKNMDELMMYYESKLIIDSTLDFPSDAQPAAVLTPTQSFSLKLVQGMAEKDVLNYDFQDIFSEHATDIEDLLKLYSLTYGESWDINILPIVRELGCLNPHQISNSDIAASATGSIHKSEEFTEIADVVENRRHLVMHLTLERFPALDEFTDFDDIQELRANVRGEVIALKSSISDFASGYFSMDFDRSEIESHIVAIEKSFRMAKQSFYYSKVGVVVKSAWDIYKKYQSLVAQSGYSAFDMGFHLLDFQRPSEAGEIKAYCINDFI